MRWAQAVQPLGAAAPQAASCGAGACLQLLTRPLLLRGGGAASHPPPRRNCRRASAVPEGGSSSSSFDGEEEDLSLSRELERMTAPDKYRRLASHLDLLYSVQNDEVGAAASWGPPSWGLRQSGVKSGGGGAAPAGCPPCFLTHPPRNFQPKTCSVRPG